MSTTAPNGRTKLPGRRTANDAYTQAYHFGRTGSLSHSTDNTPLGPENLVYLWELRRLAAEWTGNIDREIRQVEDIRRRLMEQR